MRLWFWLALALVIVGTNVPRMRDGGRHTWVARSGSAAAAEFEGVVLEWEWVDVAQSAWFAEGDPRWQGRLDPAIKGQNLVRFIPGLAVAWAGVWLRDARIAAIVLTWLVWLAAAMAVNHLARRLIPPADRGARTGAIAAALVALSPGFAAFFGNIDAHPFGYAAAPIALLALERARSRASALGGARGGGRTRSGVIIGAMVFLANGTLELGAPLLGMLWLFYTVPNVALAMRRQARAHASHALVWAAGVTLTYLALEAVWSVAARAAALGHVESYNEGLPMLLEAMRALSISPPDRQNLTGHFWETVNGFAAIFPRIAVQAAVVGIVLLPRRAALWCLAWTSLVVAASLLTRNFARVHYLAYPAVSLAAAAAAERAGSLLAAWGPRVRSPWLRRLATAAHWSVPVLLVAMAARVALADLSDDLSLVRVWWQASQ